MMVRLSRSIAQVRAALAVAAQSAAQRSGKGPTRQAVEMLLLRARGFSPDDYYTLRLYERSVSDELLSRRRFSELRQRLNPHHLEVVPFNKWVSGIYLEALGLRVPTCYGIYHPVRGVQRDGSSLRSVDEIAGLLARVATGVVFKPLDASHGQGVAVVVGFDAAPRSVRRASGAEQPLAGLVASFASYADGWVVQQRIEQHPSLAALHPQSINTVRVVTICRPTGRVDVLGAVLRMGTGVSEVDNTTGGGVVATIDLASGRCGAAYSRYRVAEFAAHPTSGVAIAGMRLPHWDEIQATVLRAHQLLPFPRTLGWDVAIASDGPVILEVNSDYYYNHLQLEGPSGAAASLGSSG